VWHHVDATGHGGEGAVNRGSPEHEEGLIAPQLSPRPCRVHILTTGEAGHEIDLAADEGIVGNDEARRPHARNHIVRGQEPIVVQVQHHVVGAGPIRSRPDLHEELAARVGRALDDATVRGVQPVAVLPSGAVRHDEDGDLGARRQLAGSDPHGCVAVSSEAQHGLASGIAGVHERS